MATKGQTHAEAGARDRTAGDARASASRTPVMGGSGRGDQPTEESILAGRNPTAEWVR